MSEDMIVKPMILHKAVDDVTTDNIGCLRTSAHLREHIPAGSFKGWHELVLKGRCEAVLQGLSQGPLQLAAQACLKGSSQLWAG